MDEGKTAIIVTCKKLVEKVARKLLIPYLQKIIVKYINVTVRTKEVTKKVNEALAKNVDEDAINLSQLIDGSSLNHSNASKCKCNSRSCKTVKWI